MGVVYEAVDRESSAKVALKTLRGADPDSAVALKNEFRALQDLYHPNLVGLGELIEDGGELFFTMELVDGVAFLDRVRDGHGYSEQRLRDAFGQLTKGLYALHRLGKVHRDVKPSNILVTPGGRVVILDFGLVADARESRRAPKHELVGSVAYMAPEQAIGADVGVEADWYSAGVLLYESLTGRPPFSGTIQDVLESKQRTEPPPPRELLPGVAQDLDQLCVDLLHFDPKERPRGDEVLLRLGLEDSFFRRFPESVSRSLGRPVFVGRAAEMAVLDELLARASAGRPTSVFISGPSGVGKTTLLARFDAGAEAVLLRGRCHARDSVPYKALDGVFDDLAALLQSIGDDEVEALVPESAGVMAEVFPVLRRVPAFLRAVDPAGSTRDVREQRRGLFSGIRDLLWRLSASHRVVLAVDDLHLSDPDSIVALSAILRQPDAPPILFVATVQSDATEPLDLGLGDVRVLEVSALERHDANELARRLLARIGAGARVDPEQVAAEGGGHPLFIDELVRHAALSGKVSPRRTQLDDALGARIDRLMEEERLVLELISIASGPAPRSAIAEASGLPPTPFSRCVGLLRVSHLVRAGGAHSGERLDTFHSRVRDAAAARIDPERLAQLHRAMAFALERSESAPPEQLARHFRAAGELGRALAFAETAARAASAALAFERAARLFREALELAERLFDDEPEQIEQLRMSLANALADAGLGEDAAREFLALADSAASGSAELEMRRRAAEQLLHSGNVDAGFEVLSGVLRSVGARWPKTPRRAVTRLIARRVHLKLRGLGFRERQADEIAKRELTRVDVFWTAATTVSMFDSLRGLYFVTNHLLEALRAGEPYRVSRALALEGMVYATLGKADRAAELIQSAQDLGERVRDPHAIGLAQGLRGISNFLRGHWAGALDDCRSAADILRQRCPNVTYELANADLFSASAMFWLGDYFELRRFVHKRLSAAGERADAFADVNLRAGVPAMSWLAAAEPAHARSEVEFAIASWSSIGYHAQHLVALWVECQIDLYEGNPAAALERLGAARGDLRRAQLLRVKFFRQLLLDVEGRALIATGDRAVCPRVEAIGKTLAAGEQPHTTAQAIALRAGSATLLRDPEAARVRYAAAADAFDQADMPAHAHAARRRRAESIAGLEREMLIEEADQNLSDLGAENPVPFSRVLAS